MKMKILSMMLVVCILLGVALVAAQQNNDENVINAAYHRVTGALRIVHDGNVRPQEILLSWNKLGPQGERGEQGLIGPVGPTGPEGVCSCPISLEMYNNLLVRIEALEGLFSFTSETIHITNYDLNIGLDGIDNMHIFGKYSGVPNQFVTISNSGTYLQFTSTNEGWAKFIISTHTSSSPPRDQKFAMVELETLKNGTILYSLIPWAEESVVFTDRDSFQGEPSFSNVQSSNEDVAIVFGFPQIENPQGTEFANLTEYGFFVYALSQGEAIITLEDSDGIEFIIEVEVDENRAITRFDVNQSDYVAPEPEPNSCSDGTLNGQETDVDCGGPDCEPCSHLSMCYEDRDCENNIVCDNNICSCIGETNQHCSGFCVNVLTDNYNCGECSRACNPNEFCSDGTCMLSS